MEFLVITEASHDCDFEDFSQCNWLNSAADNRDWQVKTGGTPSGGTGPTQAYG